MGEVALLVIDMQAGLFRKGTPVYRADELIANINSLIDAFHAATLPVVFIRHTNGTSLAEGTDDWQLHSGLHTADCDLLLNKKVSSAFKEKAVVLALKSLGIHGVVVTGLVTHGCVKAACEGAMEQGYAVTLAADGHSSFNADAEALIGFWNNKLGESGVDVTGTNAIIQRFHPQP